MPNRPNLLVIMSDQHAPDALGGAVQTPWLDRLAARGVRFDNAYCAYPMCTPSRASFMTGLHAPAHGVWELGTPLPSDLPTWAHVLRRAGYVTSLAGRMHFVGHDQQHGFERRPYPDRNTKVVPYCYGDWDKPQTDEHVMVHAVRGAGPLETLSSVEQYDQAVVAAARQELQHFAGKSDDRPWALTVGLLLPHFPYTVSKPWYDRYEGVDIPMPRTPPDGASFAQHVPPQLENSRKWLGLSSDGLSDEQVRRARRCYYGMVSAMDEMIGSLLQDLEKLGLAQDTWVVYLSDHGENLGEHGFWSKLNFYDDSVRVPMIIAPPKCPQAGARCPALVSLVDWMATMCAFTDQQPAFGPLPGRSLLPLLANPAQSWDDRVILSDYACGGTRVPMRMVRQGPWKACLAPGYPSLLFNLQDDPHEWHDLAAAPASAGILAQLEQLAAADGWDGPALRQSILQHKRRLQYIDQAEQPQPSPHATPAARR